MIPSRAYDVLVSVAYDVAVVLASVLFGAITYSGIVNLGRSNRSDYESKRFAAFAMMSWRAFGAFLGFVFATGLAENFAGLTLIP